MPVAMGIRLAGAMALRSGELSDALGFVKVE